MKIQINSIWGGLLFEGDFSSIAEAVKAAIKAGADLSSADLSSADLSGADLSTSTGLAGYAQVSFRGHGECGRMLTAVRQKKGGAVRFFCGCFTGTEKELRKYIADGSAHLRKTRTLALDTVLVLIEANNEEAGA